MKYDDYECRHYDLFTGDGKSTAQLRKKSCFHRSIFELTFTEQQVKAALAKDSVEMNLFDYAALLSPAALPLLEQMANVPLLKESATLGMRHIFFHPFILLIIRNRCLYCGFALRRKDSTGLP